MGLIRPPTSALVPDRPRREPPLRRGRGARREQAESEAGARDGDPDAGSDASGHKPGQEADENTFATGLGGWIWDSRFSIFDSLR
jgi:hypothetical protein